jgi:hypothetical protein
LERNQLTQLPNCLKYCAELVEIDLWDNPINEFPESLAELKKLQKVDLQGVMYGPAFQRMFKEKLPNVKVLFDPPCSCME